MGALWPVDRLVEAGVLERQLAGRLEQLVFAGGAEEARRLSIVIEHAVAPPNLGLTSEAPAVAEAVIAGLPVMRASVRHAGVALLNQIAGWLLAAGASPEHDVVRSLTGALPGVAGLASVGDDDMRAEFVDFAALCAALDSSVVDHVVFYLRRVIDDVGGAIGASARLELERLAR